MKALSQMLSSDRIFTPRPTPEMADRVAIRLMPPMSQSWLCWETSMPNIWLRPVFIWETPSPKEVATPNTVPNTASTSAAWPQKP